MLVRFSDWQLDALPSNIQLTDEHLDEYAAAVAGDEPFEFHLRG